MITEEHGTVPYRSADIRTYPFPYQSAWEEETGLKKFLFSPFTKQFILLLWEKAGNHLFFSSAAGSFRR